MMKLPVVFSLLAVLSGCAGIPPEQARLESLYVETSSDAAMASLACVIHSAKNQKNWAECDGDGWTGLAINRSPAAPVAIAQLVALRMDASMSEARGCLTLQRGRETRQYLKSLDAATARAACESQWERVRANNDPPRYPDVEPDEVCNNMQDIGRVRDVYITKIEAGEQCWPWLFD
ncbi:MAG: hypothetical protein LBR95_00855 [Azoarcus sp.]|jgi:hypothetical protein|nr:hypothetical protein [Azoarcus sp.]